MYSAHEVYTRLMALRKQNGVRLKPSEYTVNIQPRTSSERLDLERGDYHFVFNRDTMSFYEYEAYALWYHGYTVQDVLRIFCDRYTRMRRIPRSFPSGQSMMM